jgi:predicted nucleic-acid-binding protein
MVGLDTNILLRALLNEDPVQSPQAQVFLATLSETDPGYVGITAVAEIHWVLLKRYRIPKPELISTLRILLNLPALEFESFEAILRALDLYEKANADFPDALLAERNSDAGCTKTYTFDKPAASRIPGMELLS